MMKWLRENFYVSLLLLIGRVYLGWQWLDAGYHKITGGFDATGFLKGALENPVMDKATGEALYPTFNWFIETFALPNADIINVLIPWGETLVGLGLILGTFTTMAAFFGLLMNFMFMFAGTVSSNPWLMLIGFIVLIAGANAGRIGGDRYVLPYIKLWFERMKERRTLAMDVKEVEEKL